MPRSRYVIDGPRWFRMQIRHRGPLYALAPPLVAGLVAIVCISMFDAQITGILGLTLAYFAAPVLPMVGAPFSASDRHPLAIGISALLWVAVGLIASRRAGQKSWPPMPKRATIIGTTAPSQMPPASQA